MNKTWRRLRRLQRAALLTVAAAPILQFSQCQTLVGQAGLTTIENLPSSVINSLGSAIFQTVITVLGIGNQVIFQSIFGGS